MIQENTRNDPESENFTGNEKFKLVNYEFNSSSNLHFKTQRNTSVLSGVNYPKKNLQKGIRREDSCGGNSDHILQNGTMPSIHPGNLSQFKAP